jgi:hypothetical protein
MPQNPLIGALRIRSARVIRAKSADAPQSQDADKTATTQTAEPSDPYFARLVKLVPAEVLALYVALKVVAGDSRESGLSCALSWYCWCEPSEPSKPASRFSGWQSP